MASCAKEGGGGSPLKNQESFPIDLIFFQYKNIGASIRIGQEILCLPYEGFFLWIIRVYLLSSFCPNLIM